MNRILLTFISILLYTTAFSQTSYVWNGTSSTNWNTSANWTPNGIPGTIDNATIVTGSNNCALSGNTSLTNLTITSGLLNLNGFTLNTTSVVACNGGTCSNGTFNSTATSLTFAGTTFGANINANVTEVYFNGSIFNGNVTVSKNGTANAQSNGNNTFNGNTSITNAGTGYLLLTNGGAGRVDNFNGATTLNTTNTGNLHLGWGRDVSFNANVIVNNTASTGNIFLGNTGSVNLNTGITITCGTFIGGALNINKLVQTGSTPLNLSPGNAGGVSISGSSINGVLTINAGIISAQTSTFAAAVNYNAGGTILNTWSAGGNVYNGILTINNSSNGYLGFANGSADTYNADVYANNTSTTGGRILFGNNSSSSQFNGNIYVSQSGPNTSAGGIALGWGGAFPVLNIAATKSIITSGTFNSGYLQLYRVQQNGATPNIINATGTANVILSNNIFDGALTVTAPDITPNGGTYNSAVTFNKTGGTSNHNSGNLNIFNSTCTINQSSSTGYFMLGFNSADQFNDDITVTSTNAGGIRLGHNSGTGTPTLASGKTVSIGGAGFSAGYLVFGSFTQLGSAPITLNTTGSTAIYISNANSPCVFGGAFNATAADLYIQGGTFNGPAIFTKTGGVSEHNSGIQNIFNSTCTINQQSSTGYFMLGYNSNDLFNDDITVTSTGTGGIYLGFVNGTGSPTLASGKTISIGAAGFNDGFLYFGGFTQLGSAPINLSLSGASTSLIFRASTFGGNIISSSASVLFNSNTFNGSVNATKTGNSNDASPGGNIFNTTSEFTNTGSGYYMFGNGTSDIWNGDVTFTNSGSDRILPCWNSAGNQFNGNITLNSTGSSQGINFCGGNAISTATLAATKTINTGTYDKGYLILNRFTQLGNAAVNLNLTAGSNYLNIGPNSTIGGNLTINAESINNIYQSTFNGSVSVTKNGSANDSWGGGNTFNSTTNIVNNSAGYIILGNGNPDTYNGDVTYTNSGSNYIAPSYNSPGNLYNGNITLNSIGSSVGINFSPGASGTSTLAATKTIQTGGLGYSSGYLLLQRFTQLGNAAVNLTATANYIQFGPNSTIGGNLTSTSPNLILNSTLFNGTSDFTITGLSNQYCPGGNTFNGLSSITHNGTGFFILGNSSSDTWNSDVTFNNNSNERILPAWATVGNLFNGNIYVNTTGSAQGIQFCGGNATATATLAATKSIFSGGTGLNAGYLILKQFTQLGNAPINLTLSSSATYLQFGPSSSIGGNVTSVSPRLYFNGCTFNGTTNCTKNGAVDDQGIGNNIFNGSSTMTNLGSGYLMFGNGNSDQFNSTATFNNLGTNHIYVAHNSTNNIFGGVVTFNNAPTGNYGIFVSGYSTGTVFNENIVVSNVNGSGVQFCSGNVTATSTLAAGKTITIGAAGFNSGTLLLKQFTQLGGTPQSFTTTGTSSIIQYGPLSSFGGNITSVSPRIYFNGCTFNGTTNCTKNGAGNDDSNGANVFTGNSVITNSGTGYLLFGNINQDIFSSDLTINNTGTNNVYLAHNSNGNVFSGNLLLNNTPLTSGCIYLNYFNYTTNYNGNIVVNSTAGTGVHFGEGSGSAILASGKTISIGSSGFAVGTLMLKNFTQLSATPQSLPQLTGTSILQLGPVSRFDGDVNFNFPQVYLNGTTYNGSATIQKNGVTDNPGAGGNIFNGTTIINNTGSGYLMTGNGTADAFNGVATFNNTGSYRIYFAHNHAGQTTTFAQGATLNSTKSGGADQWTYLIAESANSNLRFDGDLTINIAGTIRSDVRILQGATTNAIYNGNVNVNLTNTNSTTQINLGTVGTSAYNGNITLVNTGAGTSSGIFFNTTATATSNLAATKTIGLGAGGFTGGTLSMIRFTQLGATPQTLSQTTGTSILISGLASTFDGDVNFNFPQIYLNGATYNGAATIQKNGVTDNSSVGGNIFNGTTAITNISSNFIRLANSTPDNYNADVIFTQNNSGVLAPNYNTNCNYGGNVTVSSTSAYTITFGSAAAGIATFNGGNAQIIAKSGSIGNPVFTRLVVNKTANDITLNTRINISSTLILTQGIINTTNSNILNMNNASTTTVGNASSYINGPMNYDMALNGSRILNFPIGKVEDWRPASLNAIHNNATSYTYKAELTNTDANTLGWAFPATVNLASHVHWWDIERSNTATSVLTPTLHLNGNQTITLFYGANDGVTDPGSLTIIKNTVAASNSWIDIGGSGASMTAGSVSSTSAPSAFNSFSRFSLGNKTGGTNPLPIELLYFTANPLDKIVNLDWSTASETNNDYYEIERSTNGVDFELLTKVDAYGNGNSVVKQTYNTIDEKPYKGISYYRLKQVDVTETFKYSSIVSVEFNSKSFVNIFPNPASHQLNINYSEDFTNASVKIINSVGAEVITNTLIDSFKGNLDVSSLANGIYYVVIQNGEHTEKIKLNIQK